MDLDPLITIYHNGECSKCRGTLEIMQERGIPHRVRWYLADPLSRSELQGLISKLGISPAALVRKSEPLYKEQYEGRHLADDDWMDVLTANPILIERPIVAKGATAIVARPSERVLEML